MTALGWTFEQARRISLDDYWALKEYWASVIPPANWLLAGTFGFKGIRKTPTPGAVQDVQDLMSKMRIDPSKLRPSYVGKGGGRHRTF